MLFAFAVFLGLATTWLGQASGDVTAYLTSATDVSWQCSTKACGYEPGYYLVLQVQKGLLVCCALTSSAKLCAAH